MSNYGKFPIGVNPLNHYTGSFKKYRAGGNNRSNKLGGRYNSWKKHTNPVTGIIHFTAP